MGPFYALDLRKAVAAVAPGIVLTFDTVSRPVDLEDSLRDGILDVAIDWLPIELDPFVNRKLFDDRVVLVARRDHPRVRAGVTIERLRKEEFICLHHRCGSDNMPQALRKLHDLQFHEGMYVSELLEVPTVVASTDLLGLMPSSMGPLLEERFGLQVLAMPLELPTLPIYMIWHETRRHDAAHGWLREVVVAELASPTAKFRAAAAPSPRPCHGQAVRLPVGASKAGRAVLADHQALRVERRPWPC